MERLNKGVFQKMTEQEKLDLAFLTLAGSHKYEEDSSVTVMMGIKGIQRVFDKEKEMNEKYSKK
jgi:hypothetical protein